MYSSRSKEGIKFKEKTTRERFAERAGRTEMVSLK